MIFARSRALYLSKGWLYATISMLVWFPSAALRWRRLLRKYDVQLINIHFPDLNDALFWVLLKKLRLFNGNIVLSFHGADVTNIRNTRNFAVARIVWRLTVRCVAAFTACSSSLAEELAGLLPIKDLPVHTVWNGVDATKIGREVADCSRPKPVGKYIIYIGGFERKKGLDVLLEAFRIVRRSISDIDLFLVCRGSGGAVEGDFPTEGAETQDGVHVFVDCPHDMTMALLANANALVIPSRREPFGIVALEAAVLGIPVVLTEVCGVLEMLEKPLVRVVPTEEPERMAAAIADLLVDEEAAEAAGKRLRESLSERASWSRAAKELLIAGGVMVGPQL